MELFENRMSRAANWDALQIFLERVRGRSTRSRSSTTRRRQRRIPFAPVSTMGDLLVVGPPQGARLLRDVGRRPAAARVMMPGAPYHHSATPWRIRHRAPRLGEHTDAVLAEIGYAPSEIARLRTAGVVQ